MHDMRQIKLKVIVRRIRKKDLCNIIIILQNINTNIKMYLKNFYQQTNSLIVYTYDIGSNNTWLNILI